MAEESEAAFLRRSEELYRRFSDVVQSNGYGPEHFGQACVLQLAAVAAAHPQGVYVALPPILEHLTLTALRMATVLETEKRDG